MELFPFSNVRAGQKEFMEDVKKCLEERNSLIANAPTGIGKTAATIAPALSYALENGKTVVFLTPKHSQHRIVIDTLRKIHNKFGISFNATDIIGKKWLCPVQGIETLGTSDFADYCNSVKKDEKCVFYNCTRNKEGFTQKSSDVLDKIKKSEPLHAEEMKELCSGMCPYEISLEAARTSHVIICDYYHIFSPVRSTFLRRTGKELKDMILIVDEAHNIPERVRKILSGKITTMSAGYAEKEARAFGFHELADKISVIEKALRKMARTCKEREDFVKKEDFTSLLAESGEYNELLEEMQSASLEIRESRKKSFIGSLARFIELWNGDDLGYARILRKDTRNDKTYVALNYACLDPMLITKDVIQDAHSVILMSGTLTPMSMYRNLLGFEERALCKVYESSFPASNRMNIIIPDVTTQYTKRTEDNMNQIASYIEKISNSVPGSLAAFFPSYELRERIFRMIDGKTNKILLLEKPEMTKEEKTSILNNFMNCRNAFLLGTQGGSFAEGVDYIGNVMKCVIVVGISLSHPDLETKSLINYYDYKFKRGWEYGYIYPAVHRAMQSAGRCIRNEKDRAVVVFMDSRFLWGNYRAVFPTDMHFAVTKEPEKLITNFFSVED